MTELICVIRCHLMNVEFKLISSAVHTIDIIFSSFNIFYIQEKLGVIQSLKNKAKHGVNIRILTLKSGYVEKTVQALKKEIVDGSFDAHYFSWNSDIRTKTLIVDREQSLAKRNRRKGNGKRVQLQQNFKTRSQRTAFLQ
jgi:phosphatidylserine/phosphatidylglycerophosphate/cardiolipin synthase-like enzyme